MLYIILPVHNRKNITELFIKSLLLQTYKNFKLILVDDGSTDGTDKMVLNYLPNSIIIKGDGNLWWGGGLQKGYDWIKANTITGIVLLINDDTIFSEDFLSIGVELINNSHKTLYLAQNYDKNNNLIESGIRIDWQRLSFNQTENNNNINCLSTRGLILRATDFIDIGGFRPKILPHYLSDYEFTVRAYRKGYKLCIDENFRLVFDTEATGFHKIEFKSYTDYFKKFFSKKNPISPFYFVFFLFLSCPKKYLIKNLFVITFNGLKKILSIKKKSN